MSHQSLFKQKLTHKALSFKFSLGGGSALVDHIIDSSSGDSEELAKLKVKNVCAALSIPLIERLENTLGILGMSKREFFEMAIIQALDEADKIIEEVDVFELAPTASAPSEGV